MKSFLVLAACVLFVATVPARAQEIQASVEVITDQLNPALKEYLSDFKQKVETYVNDFRWTDVDFNGDRIPVTVSINFLSGSPSGDFTAQIVVVSQRRVYEDGRPTEKTSLISRFLDPKWSFAYQQGQPFYHDQFQFNDLTSLLDFYMYVVIGMDFDSMEPLQGTPWFQRAATIGQRAQSTNRASEWVGAQNSYSRMNLVNELQNANYEPFRSALYWYYYEGLDFLVTEKEEAQKSIARGLGDIADILQRINTRSILLTMWLESKSSEFCSLLDGFGGKPALMTRLMQVDAVRAETYRRCSF